ncbi:MAG: hypothetical protein ACLFQV_05135 [Vulcanimicrobiota bacterium]
MGKHVVPILVFSTGKNPGAHRRKVIGYGTNLIYIEIATPLRGLQ